MILKTYVFYVILTNMEKGFTYELLIILKTFILYVILTNKTHDSRFPFFKNKFKTTVNFA